jgi:hypothetical protein
LKVQFITTWKKPVFHLDPEREKLKRRSNQEKASPEEFEKV